jgi:two-component system sensor histidine kinase KdpD
VTRLIVGFVTVAMLWVLSATWLIRAVVSWTGWPAETVTVVHELVLVALAVIVLVRSLSSYRQLATSTVRRWEDLASTTREGLVVVEMGDAGRIRYVNQALEQLTGRSAEEFRRDPTLPFQIVAEEDAGLLRAMWLSPLSQDWPVTLRLKLPDGSLRAVEMSGAISHEGAGPPLFQGIVTDVTDGAASRTTMQAAEAEMAKVVAVRDGLLTAMSHELRTPLTVVSGWAQTLQQHRGRLTRAQQLQAETAIWEHAQRLASMVDDLLQLDRSGPGSTLTSLGPCDAGQVVAAAVSASRTAHRTQVSVPESLPVIVDRDQLRRIVHELLRNTDKYAPDGLVAVTVRPGEPGWWELEVSDTGPGLPDGVERDALEVFTRYDQAHPSPGAGLGLALVDRFVQAHGGTIRLVTDGGLTVTVTMPIEPDPVIPTLHAV